VTKCADLLIDIAMSMRQ